MSDKSASKRTRNYATVVYPESAPADWEKLLSEQYVAAFISPLHDLDINPTGEHKKPHFHVLIMFDGPKSKEQAEAIFKKIGGVGCEAVQSIRGYARYLCHLDNPEKHQYDPSYVKSICGADYMGIIGLVTDKYKAIREMIEFCVEHECYSYADLLDYASINRSDWFRVLCDNGTYVVKEYLKSRAWTDQQQQ